MSGGPSRRIERVQLAARNNAVWCDTVCRAHGRPGEFFDSIWINRHETPPFYPNAVTLSGDSGTEHLSRIRDLNAAGISGEWAVKDSFLEMDLAPLGFRVLFEAHWIYRPVSPPPAPVADAPWTRVGSPADLADWEAAWRGESAPGPAQCVFPPSLLRDPAITFVVAHRRGRIVAGAITNVTANAVGLSNMFGPSDEIEQFRVGCLAHLIEMCPRLPVVGYESGEDLLGSLALGFEAVGPLRVWGRASD
ncbi:MAG TPA: hypothetical protein VMW17_15060 [Candidatus Binatia bacterium]|nr:hypothetical protein [Candidatus Binatia bacterium]